MTEAEWLACTDPQPMFDFVRIDARQQEKRQFVVACFRRVWHLIQDPRARSAIELLEKREQHHIWDEASVSAAEEAVWASNEMAGRLAARAVVDCLRSAREPPGFTPFYSVLKKRISEYSLYPGRSAAALVKAVGLSVDGNAQAEVMRREREGQADLLRDIFGNPFRPVALNMAWKSCEVIALAKAIYDDRAFDRLPVSAHTLEESGCNNGDILDHLRGPGPHVRGCWCLDLILGKE